VAKVLNRAGYYTEPTPGHVAVSLLKADINKDPKSALYLTQNLTNVYTDPDPRTYELSSYSYMIIPTDLSNNMTTAKGYTLGTFGQFMLCVGQSQVDALGYSALPIDLVLRGFAQLRRIPGNAVPATDVSAIAQCHNPTFSPSDTVNSNLLAKTDPYPPACDKQGPVQCSTATGGAGNGTGGGGTGGGGGSGGGGGGNGGGGGGGSGGNTGGGGATGGATGSTAATTPGSTAGATGTHGVSGASGTSGQSCDPNTGICGGTTGSTGNSLAGSGQPVGDTPITLASNNGDGVEVLLMALAAGLLLLVVVAPPLIGQATKRSRQRRGIDDFYNNPEGPGRGP
jgi:hypothetical protein